MEATKIADNKNTTAGAAEECAWPLKQLNHPPEEEETTTRNGNQEAKETGLEYGGQQQNRGCCSITNPDCDEKKLLVAMTDQLFIDSAPGSTQGAIDNRIEQAMDLVKSHLMNAVRSEVEDLKEKIIKLEEIVNNLQFENDILKTHASDEVLSLLQQQQQQQQLHQQQLLLQQQQQQLPAAGAPLSINAQQQPQVQQQPQQGVNSQQQSVNSSPAPGNGNNGNAGGGGTPGVN